MEDKVCCNCGNCERRPERGSIETYCAIDNHRIGYVECFTRKCKHWKRETKWDGMEADVDAIEVVRCKNCCYRGTIICPMVHETLGNGLIDYSIDNGYCSRGKPKEDK